jgi:predicted nucleotide-binding protein (sugar kinase/HSP70/actin superfamily)
MAILQSAMVEPLLSRQQTAVIRDIARAAQLGEALGVLDKLSKIVTKDIVSKAYNEKLSSYLNAEIKRVLMQIKIPVITADAIKGDTTTPKKVAK